MTDNVKWGPKYSDGKVVPNSDATDDLGSDSLRWNNVYTQNIHTTELVASTASLASISIGGLSLQSKKEYTLGSSYTNGTPTLTLTFTSGSASQTPTYTPYEPGIVIPYQRTNGQWMLQIRSLGLATTTIPCSQITMSISGILLPAYPQPIILSPYSSGFILSTWPALSNSKTWSFGYSSTSFYVWIIGELTLLEKPSWAD